MVSCSGIQCLLNDLYASHRILQQHLFFIFFHWAFDVGRFTPWRDSMFILSFFFNKTGRPPRVGKLFSPAAALSPKT